MSLYSKETKDRIDSLLNDPRFRRLAEDELGPVSNVTVEWEFGNFIVHGALASKEFSIEDTLNELKTASLSQDVSETE